MIQKYVVIVAGGSGTRMESDLPKQFMALNEKPILMHTIETFYSFDNTFTIIVVIPGDQLKFWQELCQLHQFNFPHQLVTGGKTRFHSVKNGLSFITEEGLVAIHDGVRPLVSHDTIARCFETAEREGNAIPCIPVHETVRQIVHDKNTGIDRNSLKLIQTPQVFTCRLIKKAFEQPYNPAFTDEANVVENIGTTIHLVEGNRENIKLTEPLDLILAEGILKNKSRKQY